MIERIYTRQVRDKLGKFPAVAILGPRQCGKTTLPRWFDGAYFDMELACGSSGAIAACSTP